MMEQQLVKSREKDNFMHMKNLVSLPFRKFAPSELCQGKRYQR
jgi:hypothetical protein